MGRLDLVRRDGLASRRLRAGLGRQTLDRVGGPADGGRQLDREESEASRRETVPRPCFACNQNFILKFFQLRPRIAATEPNREAHGRHMGNLGE